MSNLAGIWRAEIERALAEAGLYEVPTVLGYTRSGEPIRPKAFERHCFVIGGPGTGKTRLLTLLCRAHIEAGHTLFLLDPHGTKPESLYQLALAEALELGLGDELLLIDPADDEFTLNWNPLSRNGLPVPTQAEYLLEAVNKSCKDFLDNEARPQHERWLLNTLERLISENRCLLDSLEILRGFGDLAEFDGSELLKSEWLYYLRQKSKRRDELTESVFNRLRRILTSPALFEMFSQVEGRFHLGELIKEPRIILCNLGSSPRLSRRASTLLGALLLAELIMALELRAKEEPQVAVICDEASRFVTPDLAIALAEMRGYGCSMTLACQTLSQLAEEERRIMETVMACCETIVAFRLGYHDARRIAQELLKYDPHWVKDEIWQTKFAPVLKPVSLSTSTKGVTESRGETVSEEGLSSRSYSQTSSYIESFSQGYVTDHEEFEEVSSRTYFALEEQLELLTERVRDLPDRQAVIRSAREVRFFEVAEVPDAGFSRAELRSIYGKLFGKSEHHVRIGKGEVLQNQLTKHKEIIIE